LPIQWKQTQVARSNLINSPQRNEPRGEMGSVAAIPPAIASAVPWCRTAGGQTTV